MHSLFGITFILYIFAKIIRHFYLRKLANQCLRVQALPWQREICSISHLKSEIYNRPISVLK